MPSKPAKSPENKEEVEASNINNFYQDSYKKLIIATITAYVAIGCLIFCIIIKMDDLKAKPPVRFPASGSSKTDLKIIPQIGVTEPNMSQQAMLQWTTNIIIKSLQLSSNNYVDQLKKNIPYFSKSAYQQYLLLVGKIYDLKSVSGKQLLITTPTPSSPPVVQNAGIYKDRYSLVMAFPIKVSFNGTLRNIGAKLFNLRIILSRKPMTNDVTGLVIEEINSV
jgi:hypothetical protein